jgi:hypothetical protein
MAASKALGVGLLLAETANSPIDRERQLFVVFWSLESKRQTSTNQ